MKIVLGLDRREGSDAVTLIKRLRFNHATFALAHVIPPFVWGPMGDSIGAPADMMLLYPDLQEMKLQEEEDASSMLRSAAASFVAGDGECATYVCHGNPVEELMEHADANQADLLAVSATHEQPIMAFLTGSVARGLVIGAHQSVLLAREKPSDDNHPVRAVMATDHSPYMNRCIEEFICFLPRGVEHLTVLTTYPEDSLNGIQKYLPNLAVSPADAMRRDLEERNRALVRRLTDAYYPAPVTITSQVSGEQIDCAIANTMKETKANLLIIGAQGHSLLERLTLGNVSFRQAMTSPYSVLILRVPLEETSKHRSAAKAGKSLPLSGRTKEKAVV